MKDVAYANCSNFEDTIKEGKDVLFKDPLKALRYFESSLETASNLAEKVQAFRMIGISYDLLGRFEESFKCFDKAKYLLYDSDCLKTIDAALLHRDYGNLYLDSGSPNLAHNSFLKSYNIFSELGEKYEAKVAWCLVARAKYLNSDQSGGYEIKKAFLVMKHSKDELDNLIWLLRISPGARFKYTIRALSLTTRSHTVQKPIRKILIIFFGGNSLYRKIFKY